LDVVMDACMLVEHKLIKSQAGFSNLFTV